MPLNVLRVSSLLTLRPRLINLHKPPLQTITERCYRNRVRNPGQWQRPLGPGNFETLSDILTKMLTLKFLTSSPTYLFPIWRRRALLCELIIYRLLAVGCASSCDRATACQPGSTAGCVPCSVEGVTSNGKWGQGVTARPPHVCFIINIHPQRRPYVIHNQVKERTAMNGGSWRTFSTTFWFSRSSCWY